MATSLSRDLRSRSRARTVVTVGSGVVIEDHLESSIYLDPLAFTKEARRRVQTGVFSLSPSNPEQVAHPIQRFRIRNIISAGTKTC